MTDRALHPDTLALHGGSWRHDPVTGAVAVPIVQSTSFQLPDTATADKLFSLDQLGFIYSRVANPTQDAFETRVAALEGGAAALAVASGQAASAYAVLNLAGAGDNVVSSTDLYGGTWALFAATLKHLGVEVRFVDPADPDAFARATDDRTGEWKKPGLLGQGSCQATLFAEGSARAVDGQAGGEHGMG